MTAVSTKVKQPPAPNPPTPTTRPSTAIQSGADLLLNLVEGERAKLMRLYDDGKKAQESRFRDFKAKNDAALTAAETKIRLQQKLIDDLTLQNQNSQIAQAGSSKELQELRSENERLKASLADIGIEYVDGSFRFDEPTTRVVEDFVQGARFHDTQVAILLGSEVQERLIPEEQLSKPVGPTEFFGVLAGVLEKGQSIAAELEMRTKARESKVLSIKDAVNGVPTKCMFPTYQTASSMTNYPAAPETQAKDLEIPQSPIEASPSWCTDSCCTFISNPAAGSKRPSPFEDSASPAKIQKTT